MLYNFCFQPKYAAKIHQNLRICKKNRNFALDIPPTRNLTNSTNN